MARRCHISIPRETWAYLIILAVVVFGAILREINLLIILSGLMFGPLWISWQLIRSTLQKVSISRQLPAAAFPGELVVIQLTLTNSRKRLDSWSLVVEDRIRHAHVARRVSSRSARLLFPYLPAKASRSASYHCRLWHRGRYRIGPARISTKVPVGMLRGDVTIRKADELLIYPRLGQLKAKWSDLVKLDRLGHRSWQRNQGSVEGVFYGLRDWRSGDSRRWIHWRSSAKRNDLVVRQFEQSRAQDFVLLLDLFPAQDENVEDEVTELAISFTATVVAGLCRQGAPHLILGVAADKAHVVKGAANNVLLNEVLEVLAEARPAKTDRFPELLSQLPRNISADDQLVIVSTAARIGPERYGVAAEQTDLRRLLSQSAFVSVTRPDFNELFEIDQTEQKLPV